MAELTSLNGFHLTQGFLSGYAHVSKQRELLNRINVFPVPDGDTGNNLISTLDSVAQGMGSSRSVHKTFREMADSAISGARGNSGMIVAQFMYGLYREVGERTRLSTQEFAHAARKAVDYAYKAIENPTEGTIISVLRHWADELQRLSLEISDFRDLLIRSYHAAEQALQRTKEELAVLKAAGVVDAGAQGLLSFLDGVLQHIHSGTRARRGPKTVDVPAWELESDSAEAIPVDGNIPFRFCTEVLLETELQDIEVLRTAAHGHGDSLIISQGIGKLRLHLHTNNPEDLLALLRGYGKVLNQKVDDMYRQFQAVHQRRGTVAIVTDSIADIPPELMDEFQIHLIPQRILWEGELYLDRVTMTSKTFYPLLDTRKEYPSSSLPDPASIRTMFRYLAAHYDSILALPVSAAISGTWNAMRLEAEKMAAEGYQIEVLDTRLNSAAQGLLVLSAARAAAAGVPFGELKNLVLRLREQCKIYVGVNTFKYMVRGGRVSRLKGAIATLLNLKPVISLDADGRGTAFGKAFSQKKLLKLILDVAAKTRAEKGVARWALVHAAAHERAAAFARQLAERLGSEPEYIMEISPIVGSHAGHGALAVALLEGAE